MAEKGAMFTTDQILANGDATSNTETISLWMARHGHQFTFEEITRLGNPVGNLHATLAHWSAKKGYRFNLDELLVFGDIRIRYSTGDLHKFFEGLEPDDRLYYEGFYLDEDYEYNAKDDEYYDIFYNGATVAHIMAREGYMFTKEDITRLGNPKDGNGLPMMHRLATDEDELNWCSNITC
jgi:hypothetical protein